MWNDAPADRTAKGHLAITRPSEVSRIIKTDEQRNRTGDKDDAVFNQRTQVPTRRWPGGADAYILTRMSAK